MSLAMAVVGVGWAGTRQIEAGREVEGVAITAIVDADIEQARTVAKRFGIGRYTTSLHEVLDEKAIDAVSICSPHAFHRAQAIQALDAGKHVLCEKPLALTVAEGEEMVARAAETDRSLFVAESDVYRNLPRALSDKIGQTAIGTLSSISITTGFSAMDFRYDGRRDWLTDPEQGGTGTWMLHGVHTVAQIRMLFGDICTVMLHSSKTSAFVRNDIEATVSGVIVTTYGLPVNLIQTTEAPLNRNVPTHRLHGTDGVIVGDQNELTIHRSNGTTTREPIAPDGISPYVRELEAFATYVKTGLGPTTGASELETLRVVEAGYRSMATGLPVDL